MENVLGTEFDWMTLAVTIYFMSEMEESATSNS
jgi:hypothetical protein